MMHDLIDPMQNVQFALVLLSGILHIIFAGAVAKDAGRLAKENIPVCLVSGITWAFATLIGGVFTAAIYWFIHRSHLGRVQ
jgi:hypothetical protein